MNNVGLFLFDDVELLDFAGPYEVFSVTSELSDYSLFRVFSVSEDGETIRTANGLKVVPDFAFDNHPEIDILIIPGGVGTKKEMEKSAIVEWIRWNHDRAKMTVSVCSGASAAGVLPPSQAARAASSLLPPSIWVWMQASRSAPTSDWAGARLGTSAVRPATSAVVVFRRFITFPPAARGRVTPFQRAGVAQVPSWPPGSWPCQSRLRQPCVSVKRKRAGPQARPQNR